MDRAYEYDLESTLTGLHLYPNPMDILTNNPPFEQQLFYLNQYKHLSDRERNATFSKEYPLERYCTGMGSIGLPGDLTSMGRFVRACFFKETSLVKEDQRLSQCFHVLDSVFQPYGASYVKEIGNYESTVYIACMDSKRGIYY